VTSGTTASTPAARTGEAPLVVPAGGEPLHYASVATLLAQFRRRTLSPVDVVRHLLERAEAYQSLHCYVTPTPEVALARARVAEQQWQRGEAPPLAGIPYGLKDVICTAGILTTGQSKILQHHVPEHDSAVEARLKDSGAALLGKLTTYEFAHGGPSWDLPWPPAMNPWKPGYLPGSTSSGAGAAVAAGLLPAAIGTDTGGSIRMPAAVCGIVGVKPTYGLVSRRGVLPNTFTFDTCGPMARTVEDAALLLDAIAGYDDADVASVDRPPVSAGRDLALGVRGVRIGWVRHWYDGDANCHSDVAPAVARALEVLAAAGAIVEEIRLSDLLTYQDCKTTISITEMFSAYEHEFRTRPQDFGQMFRNKVLAGSLIRAEDYFQALRQRLWLARELSRAFKVFDVIATAGWMTPAEPARPDKLDKFLRPPNITTPFNIGGGPAMNLPCGFSQDGLPLSLQLAAAPFDEPMMFRVGHAFQQLTDWHTLHPTEGLIQ
jgi:aspartyl-tRNA(Asn)/glutamyl-tRNA(Gln) amidotransferase subunit A